MTKPPKLLKPVKLSYSLKELAEIWSGCFSDAVTVDDILEYANEGRLTLAILVAREKFKAANEDDAKNGVLDFAEDGTVFLINHGFIAPPAFYGLLMREGYIPISRITFNGVPLVPVEGELRFGVGDIRVTNDEKERFEQSVQDISADDFSSNGDADEIERTEGRPKDWKRDCRTWVIRAIVAAKGWDPQNINFGGKAEVEKICLDTLPDLFSKSTFKKAWQVAPVRMKNHETYLKGSGKG